MRTRDMKYLSVILVILISAGACVPKVVTPEFSRKTYVELKDSEPDCSREIEALRESPNNSDELILGALYCYRKVWKHWENEYRVLDARLGALNDTR